MRREFCYSEAEGRRRLWAGKSVLLVIAPAGFNDTEYSTVRNSLTQAGATVSAASATHRTAVGMQGTQDTPDMTIDDTNALDYDAVILIGGVGVENAYLNNSRLYLPPSSASGNGKIVGAI